MQNILQEKEIILIVFTFLSIIQITAGKATFTATSNLISRGKRQSSNGTGCLLPPQPQNGVYSLNNGDTYIENAYAQVFTFIDLECNEGFQPSQANYFVCAKTSWAPEISDSTCIRSCPSLPSTDTYDTHCYYGGVNVSCENPLNGTSARAICKPLYTYGGKRVDSLCRNGFWDSHPTPCQRDTCPSLPSTDTYDTHCYHRGVEVTCENPLGRTEARTICKPFYIYQGNRTNHLCINGFWDSQPIPCEPGCLLPAHPQNGTYSLDDGSTYFENTYTVKSSLISLKCNEGFKTSEIHNFICRETLWVPEISKGTCTRTCPTLPSTDTYETVCKRRGEQVSCENPLDGTLARTLCKPFYIYRGTRANALCRNGTWDSHPTPCEPDCGRKIINAQLLVVGDSNAIQGEYPWMVAIYKNSSNRQTHICGGTLISRFYILSAAHCFTNAIGVPYPKEDFTIVAGKYYRELNIQEDGVQSREVERLIIHHDYKGRVNNFQDNIALIEIKRFDLSLTVQPVCIDWDNSYEELDFRENNTAVVAGWGFTKEGSTPAEVLKKLIVPYRSENVCKEHMDPEFFKLYYTTDKICAGFKDKGTSICNGDSGGGLYFKSTQTSFFIRGIVSLTRRSETGCDTNHYALYTKVSKYLQWIEDITRKRV